MEHLTSIVVEKLKVPEGNPGNEPEKTAARAPPHHGHHRQYSRPAKNPYLIFVGAVDNAHDKTAEYGSIFFEKVAEGGHGLGVLVPEKLCGNIEDNNPRGQTPTPQGPPILFHQGLCLLHRGHETVACDPVCLEFFTHIHTGHIFPHRATKMCGCKPLRAFVNKRLFGVLESRRPFDSDPRIDDTRSDARTLPGCKLVCIGTINPFHVGQEFVGVLGGVGGIGKGVLLNTLVADGSVCVRSHWLTTSKISAPFEGLECLRRVVFQPFHVCVVEHGCAAHRVVDRV